MSDDAEFLDLDWINSPEMQERARHVNEVTELFDRVCDLEAERDRLQATADAAQALVEALDSNPIGEYGDAVCETIDQLDAKLKAATVEAQRPERVDPDIIQRLAEGRGRQLDRAVDQIEELTAERDRLRAALGARLVMDEIVAERDRLRKTLAGIRLWFGVVDDETLIRLVRRAVDERDRLRAVVERFQEANAATLAACASDQSTAALEEYRAAVDALLDLDVSGFASGTVEIGGQVMTQAQYDAARFPVTAERDRLRAAVDGLTETVTRDLHVLLRISTVVGERELAPDEAAVGVNFDELPGQVQALVAERDRLRAVVEAAHGVLTGLDWSTGGGKKLVPVTALHALRDALDGSGDMGGEGKT